MMNNRKKKLTGNDELKLEAYRNNEPKRHVSIPENKFDWFANGQKTARVWIGSVGRISFR